jgi:hypothetical protein
VFFVAWGVRECGAAGAPLVEHGGVVGGVDQYRHVVVILRRRADHRRAPDVDVLDRVLERTPRFRDRRFERVQVHHYEVDRLDPVGHHLLAVPRIVAPSEQAAVDLRVQGLHPSIEDLG